MDLYQYVAGSDIESAKSVIQQFGFTKADGQPIALIHDPEVIAGSLAQLVTMKQDEALSAIADIHPDKDLLYQKFQSEQSTSQNGQSKSPCGCGGGSSMQYAGHGRAQAKQDGFYLTQTSAIMLAAGLLIVVAIVKN